MNFFVELYHVSYSMMLLFEKLVNVDIPSDFIPLGKLERMGKIITISFLTWKVQFTHAFNAPISK